MLVKDKIRELRRLRGLSAKQLGELIGVTQPTITRYENGYVRVIPEDAIEKMAEVFSCTKEDIIGGDGAYVSMLPEDKKAGFYNRTDEDNIVLDWFHGLTRDAREHFLKYVAFDTQDTSR